MLDSRRYIVHGRMPLRRTPQSGLFTTRFKEDAFYIDYNERTLFFNSGARTEQSLQLPLYFIEEGYYMQKKMVESVGFTGGEGKLELFLQYPLLPVLDKASLDNFRQEVIQRAETTRTTLLPRQEQQALIDMLMLGFCDEPLIFFDYDRPNFTLRLKAQMPKPGKLPIAARTKRGRLSFFREYEDLVCSKAGYYLVNGFEQLPFVQQIELTLLQMGSEPINGLTVVDETEEFQREVGLRRIDPANLPHIETSKERKAREKAEKARQKTEQLQLKTLSKDKQRLAFTQREPDPFDELFDGSLTYQSPLLSARIPRQGFMDLQKSKLSYSARRAMEMFELHLETDEETSRFSQVESFF